MRLFRLAAVIFAALVGVGLLYALDEFKAPSFLQDVGNDVFGAAITALTTWALFWPTKRLEQGKLLRRNHLELLTLAIAPKQLSWQVVEIFVERANSLSDELPENTKEAAKVYVKSLEGFRDLYDQKDPSKDPKNNGVTYRDTWNATYDPFLVLLKKLNGEIEKETRKNPDNFNLQPGQITPPTIPTYKAEPFHDGLPDNS